MTLEQIQAITPNLVSFMLTFSETLVCIILFTLSYKRRKLFVPRVIGSVLVGIALCFLFSLWITIYKNDQTSPAAMFGRTFTYTVVSVYLLGMLFFCYEESFPELIVCWCAAIAVKTFTGRSFALLLNFCGVDDSVSNSFFGDHNTFRDFSILIIYHLALFVVFAVIYRKRKKITASNKTTVYAVALAFFTALITCVLQKIGRLYEEGNMPVAIINKIFSLVSMTFVIVLIFGILEHNKLSYDLQLTEELLQQEKRRFEISKDTVETINMRCHDLKHRLNDLEDKLNASEIEELKQAIQIYDSNIKTNNEILDVVLYEKQLYCKANNIRLTCMADGSLVGHITPSHLYSLFGNAIDNAVDAVKAFDDTDKRFIGINLSKNGNKAHLEIYNCFEGELTVKNGLPLSTKSDKGRHGYGMSSIKFIVTSYGGTLDISTDNGIFTLSIDIPIKNNPTPK